MSAEWTTTDAREGVSVAWLTLSAVRRGERPSETEITAALGVLELLDQYLERAEAQEP